CDGSREGDCRGAAGNSAGPERPGGGHLGAAVRAGGTGRSGVGQESTRRGAGADGGGSGRKPDRDAFIGPLDHVPPAGRGAGQRSSTRGEEEGGNEGVQP